MSKLSKQDTTTLTRWFAHPVTRFRFLRFLRERLVFALTEQENAARQQEESRALSQAKRKVQNLYQKKKYAK